MTSHDEIGANLERVAESCIANLDVEVIKVIDVLLLRAVEPSD